MHHLSFVHISNFRGCKAVSLPLQNFTPLVGQNNTGKSTILEAIRWAIKPTALKAHDFSDPEQSIVVTLRIDGVSQEIINRIPAANHRAAIEPYCSDGTIWIRAVADGITANQKRQEVIDPEAYDGNDIPQQWRNFPTGLPQAVSALFPEPLLIDAMEDLAEDLGKAKAGSTIKALLDELMGPVVAAHDDLQNALSTVRGILTTEGQQRSEHLQSFDDGASQSLQDFFPGLTVQLDIQTLDIKEFFKAGDLLVTDARSGEQRRFDQMGTGSQRAIQMALVRHLAEARSAQEENPARRLLLIDEPELYLHPQGVRRLRQALLTLSKGAYQVVFSTHSPLMLERENAADAVIVTRDGQNGAVARIPLRSAVDGALEDAESQSRTLFELGNRSEIYFTEKVVLCEGKTEGRLLPLAYQRIYGSSPELDSIAFVGLGGSSDIPKALPVLRAMSITCCAIADLDFGFTVARRGVASILPANAEEMQSARVVLARLRDEHGFTLTDDGLPKNDKAAGFSAADTWAAMASDAEGREIAVAVYEQLLEHGISIWKAGCIENVVGVEEKGEEAIIAKERQMLEMTADEIVEQMPELHECFEWMRNL